MTNTETVLLEIEASSLNAVSMQMVVLSLKCTSITHKNTITTGNTFSYCSMYPIHSVLVVSAIVVKVTIFPKTLCGSLAIRD